MILRQNGVLNIHCDECSASDMSDERLFAEAVQEFKAGGWKTRTVDGVWTHTCPACVEKEEAS